MLLKSLEFKNAVGQKVKVMDIPVLEEDNPNYFLIQVRLQRYINRIYNDCSTKKSFSFREYLKRSVKWTAYEQVFHLPELKSNA
ncbi:DUF2535 family protein [Cytobacillus sp. Hz8]|uniref:DUF2535 family protein n=1 Tax=Cytobacillus sp. Hz8 TaxID=3347168 RepID=UPI0035E2D4BD